MNMRKSMNLLAGISILVIVGCMPEMSIEMMKEMKPTRPAELDKLNVFVGEWTSTSEMVMPGLDEVIKGTGTAKLEWGADRWCLVERASLEMGELGTMKSHAVWTWDPSSKKFHTFWTSSMGDVGHGVVTQCTCCGKNWTMKAKGKGAWGSTTGKGTIKIVDHDTMEWTWSERPSWDLLHLFPATTMTGTNKRK